MSPGSRPPKKNKPQLVAYRCSCGGEFKALEGICPSRNQLPEMVHLVQPVDGKARA